MLGKSAALCAAVPGDVEANCEGSMNVTSDASTSGEHRVESRKSRDTDAEPLVSVIIPTHDRPDLLRDAVRSVVAQTYDRIELVVVDDHSGSPAREAVSDLKLDVEAVKHVRHPENRGVSAARNTGIHTASGDYLAFLDDDDWWENKKVAAQVRAFQQANKKVGVVYTGIEYTDSEESLVHTPTLRGDVTRELLTGQSLAPTSTIMVRRSLAEKVGGFDEQLPSWNDRDLYIRLSLHSEFESIPRPLTVRVADHGHEQISRKYETKRDVSYPRFVTKHRPTAAQYGWRCRRRFLASITSMLAASARMNGHYGEARRYFLESIRLYPLDPETYLSLLPVIGGQYTYRLAAFVHDLSKNVVESTERLTGGHR